MIKAVIFDMDGLMIDSEKIQSKAFETLISIYKKKPILNTLGIIQTIGMTSKENWKRLKIKHNIDENLEKLINERRIIYEKLLSSNIKPMPGLIKLLKLLQNHNLKMAIASSSNLNIINLVLSNLQIKKYFQVITSGDEVKRSKPHPEIFLKTAKKINIDPKDCLVLEDSQLGVEAAIKAGMKVIAVPNKYTIKHNFSGADLIVNSLNENKIINYILLYN